jgi:glutathione S-transferase
VFHDFVNRVSKVILYSFRRCPYAIRARLVLHFGGCKFEHREILLRDKPDCMLELSPKGTVPVFYVNGQVIDESLDIIFWALENLPSCQILGLEGESLQTALDLIESNDVTFKTALDRYKYSTRLNLERSESNEAWENCRNFILSIQERLKKSRYLFGDLLSFPDFAIFPFLRQCRKVDEERFDSLDIPHTLSWMERISSLDLFTKVMQKYPMFIPDI